jgi:hypothetical protein
MPADRAGDSYAIYSNLLPLGETAKPGWPHELFLVQEAMIAVVPADRPCRPEPQRDALSSFDTSINPHLTVHPPAANNRDMKEILQDFDAHCHERLRLSAAGWTTSAPVRLLTPAEQKEFQATRTGGTDAGSKFKGVSALYGFSRVYFNASRTVAIVYATHWCGALCGQGFWVAFGLRDRQWKPLGWQSDRWIS